MKQSASLSFLIGAALVFGTAGCGGQGGQGSIGDPCQSDSSCKSGACLADFTGGYCTSDCSSAPCVAGSVCRPAGARQACFKSCGAAADCRDGYQCFQGVCQPGCGSDGDCGLGFGCTGGSCAPLPGKAINEKCAADGDCSSRLCEPNSGSCQQSCTADAGCSPDRTCYLNPYSKAHNGQTDSIRPICIPRRNKGALGAACAVDTDCDRGSCQLGICTNLCNGDGDCTASPPMSCQTTAAILDRATPSMKTCIFKSGTLTVNLGAGGSGPIGIPSSTQGFNIFIATQPINISAVVGIDSLTDPTNMSLYQPPQSVAEYFAEPVRYQPSDATSTILVPNSPVSKPKPGAYGFGTFAQTMSGPSTFTTRVRLKLGDAPYTSGHIALHVMLTDLSGAMCTFTGAARSTFEQSMRDIFAPIHLTLTAIVYKTSSAASSITVNQGMPSPQLDVLLQKGTTGDDPDVLEMVLVKQISQSGASNGFEVLGIAGGIPGSSGIPGTPHSGAAISLSSLCYATNAVEGGKALAATAAHELAHTLGLFHNIEQDNHHSPLVDDVADGKNNLMYWAEENVVQQHLSANQAAVIFANPSVAP